MLTLGSFLHDWEIEPRFRREILRHISRIPGIRKVVIESRAEYVSEQRLVALRDKLRSDQILKLGLGVESMNDHIRNEVLNKSLSSDSIKRVIGLCGVTSVGFQPYVLVKPPGLTEAEAIDDV